MATIELDIIKLRSDKLTPEEKLELIEFLTASLSSKDHKQDSNPLDGNVADDVRTPPENAKAT